MHGHEFMLRFLHAAQDFFFVSCYFINASFVSCFALPQANKFGNSKGMISLLFQAHILDL
jgi:hypothetical protein